VNFGQQIKAYVERKKRAVNAVVSTSLFELSSRIIDRTPVKTGLLRGNNQAAIDEVPNKSLTTPDPAGADTEFAMSLMAAQAPGHVFYLVNNLNYAPNIEYLGQSPKAPDGMYRISLAEFPEIWRNAIASQQRK
jgi:hypothetical protein